MTVTININGVNVEIQLTSEQEALAIKQSNHKFEWKYPLNNSFRLANTNITSYESGSVVSLIEHGKYRKSIQAAKQSLARNKRANRLEALAEQLDGLVEFTTNSSSYYIYYEHSEWNKGMCINVLYPETVYMTEECAIEICRMLNACEFSLEDEL